MHFPTYMSSLFNKLQLVLRRRKTFQLRTLVVHVSTIWHIRLSILAEQRCLYIFSWRLSHTLDLLFHPRPGENKKWRTYHFLSYFIFCTCILPEKFWFFYLLGFTGRRKHSMECINTFLKSVFVWYSILPFCFFLLLICMHMCILDKCASDVGNWLEAEKEIK